MVLLFIYFLGVAPPLPSKNNNKQILFYFLTLFPNSCNHVYSYSYTRWLQFTLLTFTHVIASIIFIIFSLYTERPPGVNTQPVTNPMFLFRFDISLLHFVVVFATIISINSSRFAQSNICFFLFFCIIDHTYAKTLFHFIASFNSGSHGNNNYPQRRLQTGKKKSILKWYITRHKYCNQ